MKETYMSMMKSKGGSVGETVIAEGVKVEGDFVSDGNVVIEGHVSGNVKASGDIVIGERAVIDADVEANNATIAGKIIGSVTIGGRADLAASSSIEGDFKVKVLTVASGARINGKLTMGAEKIPVPLKEKEGELETA